MSVKCTNADNCESKISGHKIDHEKQQIFIGKDCSDNPGLSCIFAGDHPVHCQEVPDLVGVA